ncbi:MAG: HD domain-containing protein [Clostridiaceae bacterium]|nr:HD domain-containing protein [Clostridiaceae bacterium]
MERHEMGDYEFRDPIHGFIYVRPLEKKIIDSRPFQRLRGIKQLALTHLVYHGAEHTRFGHSLGVMHLVSKAFNSAISKNTPFSKEQADWYEQILRLIALTHDLGHAPFSHGSESVFPDGLEHEDFTDNIILNTEIADYIREIGAEFVHKYGSEFDITPELICSIYHGKNVSNPDFIFLKKFMDSELDCDKMDYLLRDSLYCGVNYGKYDVDRLISCLTTYKKDNNVFLAIEKGGINAFEGFVLARYFMFIQVYFHKTRRFLDKMLVEYLKTSLPNGRYPDNVDDYLEWDDALVWRNIKRDEKSNYYADRLINRKIMKMVYESPTHSNIQEKKMYNLIKNDMQKMFGCENILFDSVEKMAHKIPAKYEIDNEKTIPVLLNYSDQPSTISIESGIINKMTEPIYIMRLYAKEEIEHEAEAFVKQRMKDMMD